MTGDPGIGDAAHRGPRRLARLRHAGRPVSGVRGVSFNIEHPNSSASWGPRAAASRRCSTSLRAFSAPTAGEIRIGGKAVTGHGLDRGVVFQDFAQLFPWRTALGNVTFGLEMKGVGKAEREEIALQAAPVGEAREIRAVLSAPSVRRHAAACRHRPRARVQSFGAADGRAVRGARRAHARRHAAAARGRLAGDAQDRDLCDPQCRGGGVSRGSRGGDDAASRHGEDRIADPAPRGRAIRSASSFWSIRRSCCAISARRQIAAPDASAAK